MTQCWHSIVRNEVLTHASPLFRVLWHSARPWLSEADIVRCMSCTVYAFGQRAEWYETTMTDMRLAYRVAEASAMVGLSEREGWRRVAAGEWRSVKCGRVTLVPAAALEDWLCRKLDEQSGVDPRSARRERRSG